MRAAPPGPSPPASRPAASVDIARRHAPEISFDLPVSLLRARFAFSAAAALLAGPRPIRSPHSP
jgi:hypothetical protein